MAKQNKPRMRIRDVFAKPAKEQRIVLFGQFFDAIRRRPGLLFVLALMVVILEEIPLRAEALQQTRSAFFWLAAVLTGALFFLLARWGEPLSLHEHLGIGEGISSREVLYGLGGGLAAFAWLFALDQLLAWGLPTYYFSTFRNSWMYSDGNFLLALLSAGLVRPLGEEFLFRGLLLTHYDKTMGLTRGLWFSALLYGLRSLDPFLLPIFFGTGTVYGLVRQKYTLRTAIMANVVCSILVILFTAR